MRLTMKHCERRPAVDTRLLEIDLVTVFITYVLEFMCSIRVIHPILRHDRNKWAGAFDKEIESQTSNPSSIQLSNFSRAVKFRQHEFFPPRERERERENFVFYNLMIFFFKDILQERGKENFCIILKCVV